ncbi:EamA family transporter [Rhodococcus rhodnii]|uniref:EamA domain-containing protein n=2 Tax=Rhodococcus rhodnii TaxID=38312 RepID=R7WME6_9NOCA|nr:EamA family transporter [Rhodococcus rhodnii]EOM76468.1 hypothetical protein Rrhod_2263 [Rhodococcus rhodnii LMG 5362]TXG91579.1 EamA family transporter [Rhodococcus rhodnii]
MNAAAAVSAVVIAAVLFGTTGSAQALASRALDAPLDPVAVGAARVVLAGLLLCALVAARRGVAALRGDVPATLVGGVGVAVYQIGFLTGVHSAGIAAGTMIALGSGPAFTGVLQWIVHRHRPDRLWLIATAVAVSGMALIVSGGSSSGSAALLGVVAALAAGLGYAIYTVAGAVLIERGSRSDSAMAQMFGVGALLLVPVLLWTGVSTLASAVGVATIVYLALVPTVLAYLLFGYGLSHLPPATVATLTLTEPVVAAALGVFVIGETLTARAGVGMAVVLSALLLLAAGTLRRARIAQPETDSSSVPVRRR